MPAVSQTKAPKHQEIVINGESLNTIARVRTLNNDVESFKTHVKTLKEMLTEEIENTDEYTAVLKLVEELKIARKNLKRRLMGNSTYVDLMSQLADEKLSLKDARENLSEFLLAYFVDTHERQIELGPANAREVVLKSSLGKSKDFQTNLFSTHDKSKS